MFHRIEAFYTPLRRHFTIGYLGPIDHENHRCTRDTITTPTPSVIRGNSRGNMVSTEAGQVLTEFGLPWPRRPWQSTNNRWIESSA